MIATEFPAELKVALERKAHGLSRNAAAARAAAISRTYRDGGDSRAIRSETDALVYALARMPATYAAVTACFNAVNHVRPDFAPQSLLDAGAGPGTATWAAARAYPSLQTLTLLDSNAALRDLALEFAAACEGLPPLLYADADMRATAADLPPADLVVASYVIGELNAAARAMATTALWRKTRDTLLVIEPGTPAGYARIIDLRRRLIALGAHVIAPCPHDRSCPLAPPDWCHFAQRLARSRAHKQLKRAELPFEDEKYSYVALARAMPMRPLARVLAQPQISKVAISAKLCTAEGIEIAAAARRDKAAYTRFRRLDWGDAIISPPATELDQARI